MKTIYGTENCVHCDALVDQLKKNGTPYKYVDVRELSSDEISAIAEESRSTSLPIVLER